MLLIPDFDYEYCHGGPKSAMRTFGHLQDCGAKTIVCRIRQSKDGIIFLCQAPTLARLCLCEERVEELRFSEIDALMRLCNMQILTLNDFLTLYEGTAQVALHFRGFRPGGDIVNRIVRDPRLSFATDSVEQLAVISQGYPMHKTVGFASHVKAAEAMAKAGAATLCLYGREPSDYTKEQLESLSSQCDIWMEVPPYANADLDNMVASARGLGVKGLVLPLPLIQ